MTSEVAYDRRFELLDLNSLCSNVSMASNCYGSQDVSSCFLLLPLLKPCQDGTLTSRASLGSKNGLKKWKEALASRVKVSGINLELID